MTDGLGDGGALGHAGADRDRHADRVGDLTGGLNSPGVAHPPGLGVAVGSRGVPSSSSNRSSSVSGSNGMSSVSYSSDNTGVASVSNSAVGSSVSEMSGVSNWSNHSGVSHGHTGKEGNLRGNCQDGMLVIG